jgi:isopropylmalate/homocitrate/citramalate synthase
MSFSPEQIGDWRKYFTQLPLKVEPMIDDSTLRDGVQMPGVAASPEHTAEIAQQLDEIGVDRIEVHHFQEPDKKAVKLIHEKNLRTRIAGWCRAVKADIDNAINLDFREIGISHPVSYIHIASKWPGTSSQDILSRITDVVEYAAKDHGLRVFVHGEDSTRADWNFEKRFINTVAEAGAEVYRICDTVGVALSDPAAALPNGIPAKIKAIRKETKIDCIEIHAHDDLGNAVENTLAAVRAASGLYEKIYSSTTFLGIGERAGNAETEKVILNLYLHHGVKKYERQLHKFKQVADLISEATGITIPPNKAIVGDYAFAHESGIHAHGVLSNPLTYELYPPELVGNRRLMTIGKQSGRAAIKHKMEEILGQPIDKNEQAIEEVVVRVKKIYEDGRKASLSDAEFNQILVESGYLKNRGKVKHP